MMTDEGTEAVRRTAVKARSAGNEKERRATNINRKPLKPSPAAERKTRRNRRSDRTVAQIVAAAEEIFLKGRMGEPEFVFTVAHKKSGGAEVLFEQLSPFAPIVRREIEAGLEERDQPFFEFFD